MDTIEPNTYQLLSLEYEALRTEICQSIAFQHRILLGGYAAVGVLFGYIAAMKPPFWPALVCIPYLLTAMTALWVVECNRMVRASFYIGKILWPALREAAGASNIVNVGWEKWIRDSEKEDPGCGFCLRQHNAQTFVVLWVPVAMSAICVVASIWTAWSIGDLLGVSVTLGGAVGLALWTKGVSHVGSISNLSKSPVT